MSSRVSSFSPILFFSVALALVPPAAAQIAAKSPFMPPQTAAATGPTEGAPLEYRGYIETSEGILYRIHDPAKKAGTWVKLNERNADFEVVATAHNEDEKTLTIEHQGKTLTLAAREAKVVSSGAAAAAVPPPVLTPAPINVSPAVTQAVVLNPTPADEQRRLDAVAAEVARRRALREQATQQLNQGVAPQIAVPQPAVQPLTNFQPSAQQNGRTNPQRTRTGPQPGNIRQR